MTQSPKEIPGIHYEKISQFFRAHVPGGDCELSFTLISGGRSNLTYVVRGCGREWVLRRPPLGHVLPTAHDMAREHRVTLGFGRHRRAAAGLAQRALAIANSSADPRLRDG